MVKLGDNILVDSKPFEDYITSNGQLVIKGITPAQLNDEFVIEIYNRSDVVDATSFTINSYIKKVYTDAVNSGDIYFQCVAAATYQYGLAAEAYASTQGK